MKVAIIGTAGRDKDRDGLMTLELYQKVLRFVLEYLSARFDLRTLHLVSGGAAWIDHIAVSLFLRNTFASLTLFLPCSWTSEHQKCQFFDNGQKDWKMNPGKVANMYHFNFAKRFNKFDSFCTLNQIEEAKFKGAVLNTDHTGFHQRNSQIANVDLLLAFTWSDTSTPPKGGTLDTWNKCKSNVIKVHFNLSQFIQ